MGIFDKYKPLIRRTLARWGIRRRFYDVDENGLHVETYHPNGRLSESYTAHRDGEKNGLYERYDTEGRLMERGRYKNGKEDGLWEYSKDGRLDQRCGYKNGILDGPYEEYFRNGVLQSKITYRNDKVLKGQEARDYLSQWRKEYGLPEKEGLDFTLLMGSQIWGDDALDVMKKDKYGVNTAPTDLAIMLGAWVAGFKSDVTSEGDLSCRVYTQDSSSFAGTPIYVNVDGKAMEEIRIRMRSISVRPVLSPEDAAKITPIATKKGVNGVDIVEYGEYPQNVADNATSAELEKLFQSQSLLETGKIYTFDKTNPIRSIHDPGNDIEFKPMQFTEYEYKDKKYIRIKDRALNSQTQLSDGSSAGWMNHWIQVQPIEWLKDPSGTLISKKCLFAGVPFYTSYVANISKVYDGNFENTFMKYYLDTYFSKEIVGSELSTDRERRLTLEGLKARLAVASDLDRARADTKPARTFERTELAARMHRSRRERDAIRAAADKACETNDEKLFQEIAELAKIPMARAQVVERKFHERRAARRADRAKSGRG